MTIINVVHLVAVIKTEKSIKNKQTRIIKTDLDEPIKNDGYVWKYEAYSVSE